MEAQHRPLALGDDLLVVRVDEEGEHRAVDAERGLDHVRRVTLLVRSTHSSFVPDACVCAVRSKSPRCAMPSSSDQPMGKRYSMSLVAD
jgi:hypothetical protein